jgi:hypothetical protein
MKVIEARIKDKRQLRKWCRKHKVPILKGYRVLVPRNGPVCQKQLGLMQEKAHIERSERFDQETLDVLYPGRKQRRFRKEVVNGYKHMVGSGVGSYWWRRIVAYAGLHGSLAREEWCGATWRFVLHFFAGYDGPWPANPNYVPDIETFARDRHILVARSEARSGMTLTYVWSGQKGIGRGQHVGVLGHNYGFFHSLLTFGGNEGSPPEVRRSWHLWSSVNTVSDTARLL